MSEPAIKPRIGSAPPMDMKTSMPERKKFNDEMWSGNEWRGLLEELINKGLLSWKDITTLTLGHMNPSQVGTSLASSEGFKRKYGKGGVMSKVMEWFYEQNGRCHDCGTRLELQADHNKPREEYDDPLDADFIENMVLRCRRCNVIRRPSHEFGGQTHLTAESALMWILFSFQPRTLPDFVRMCRLYGMTMADVRMQEGWAMAHWLRKAEAVRYVIDADDTACQVLVWPDGGLTRCWPGDAVADKDKAQVWSANALPIQHLIALAYLSSEDRRKERVHVFRYRVGNLPFSHYFPEDGAECLAITYTPPKRKKSNGAVPAHVEVGAEGTVQEELALEEMAEEAEAAPTEEIIDLPEGAKINLMPPRGMMFLDARLIEAEADASIRWTLRGKAKTLTIPAKSRGKKVCDISLAELPGAGFTIR